MAGIKGVKPKNFEMALRRAHETISDRMKGNTYRKGKTPWNKGKKGLQVAWNKDKRCPQLSGKNNGRWTGGTRYKTNWSHWIRLTDIVRERDNWTCQECGLKENGRLLDVHHNVPYKISHDNSLDNLITLCRSCHSKEEQKIIDESRCFL